jgi:hypothetical protein
MFPSENSPAVGARLSVRIFIEGAIGVGSVPFHVVYNPAVLKFEKGLEGAFLGGGGKPTAFFAAPMSSGSEMVVGLSRLGAGDGAGGSGELCTLDFTVVGAGDAGLEFTRANVRDSQNRIVPAMFDPADVTAH